MKTKRPNPFSLLLAVVVFLAGCQRKEYSPLLGTPDPAVSSVAIQVRGTDNSHPPEVSLLLQSITNGGLPMADLTLGNFAVLQDGTPLVVTDYKSAADFPFAVMLVIDRSGSMEGNLDPTTTRTTAANSAATIFLNNLPASAQAGLVEFDSGVQLKVPMTTDKASVADMINATPVATGGGTAVYDAIIAGAEELSKATGLRLLIVLTDGDDNASVNTPTDAKNKLLSIGTVAAAVLVGTDVTDLSTMQGIVNPTGGGVTQSVDPASLVTALNAILTSSAFDGIYALTFRRRSTEPNIRIYISYGSITTSQDVTLIH
ncbi:MAG: VWA domain-containing protein [Elusimicrobia bacterium]|nr:VWA domain-containing protein [Elusimicrobiota bacterium]